MEKKVNAAELARIKVKGPKITMLTAYDFPSAQAAEAGGVDMILVGDSLAMTVLGYPSTKEITLPEMLHHCRAVARGATSTHLIGDMPIGTYREPNMAVDTARQFCQAGCDSVKFEGAGIDIARALQEAGIPAIGHIGLTPQTAEHYRVQGKTEAERERLVHEARALEKAGVMLLILECVPASLGALITRQLAIPTVGIGAGPDCDGQVLVQSDLVGMFSGHQAKFVRRYAELGELARNAIRRYVEDVRNGRYPTEAESY